MNSIKTAIDKIITMNENEQSPILSKLFPSRLRTK